MTKRITTAEAERRWHVEPGSSFVTLRSAQYEDTDISVSRYGDRVVLFRERNECARALLPDSSMTDIQRCEWAVAWAERRMGAES